MINPQTLYRNCNLFCFRPVENARPSHLFSRDKSNLNCKVDASQNKQKKSLRKCNSVRNISIKFPTVLQIRPDSPTKTIIDKLEYYENKWASSKLASKTEIVNLNHTEIRANTFSASKTPSNTHSSLGNINKFTNINLVSNPKSEYYTTDVHINSANQINKKSNTNSTEISTILSDYNQKQSRISSQKSVITFKQNLNKESKQLNRGNTFVQIERIQSKPKSFISINNLSSQRESKKHSKIEEELSKYRDNRKRFI